MRCGICHGFCASSAPHQNREPFMRTTACVYGKLTTPPEISPQNAVRCVNTHAIRF
ncbi:unnamed protein product [Staurois parvus]|uniref:Uncharacterized protein n=1 Tax=Staurois parvus TaxID=386267 RepID=A0ABN9E705_9NEOB|nr:unnamed protein product [Staurois parvus]